jgi:hypothetical protein
MNPVQTEIYRTTETSIPKGSAVVRSRSDDLCYFEVDSRFGGASDLQFFNLPPFARTPRPGTACLMLGFPRDLSHVLSETEADVNMAARWTDRVRLSKDARFLKQLRRDRHFLMKFAKADQGTSAIGFSGAGILVPRRAALKRDHLAPATWFGRHSVDLVQKPIANSGRHFSKRQLHGFEVLLCYLQTIQHPLVCGPQLVKVFVWRDEDQI